MRTIRAAFRKAELWGYLNKSPFSLSPLLRVPYREPAYLTHKEFVQLYRVIPDRGMRELMVFALLTGMRWGELEHLEWEDVDFDDRVIKIRNKRGFTVKGMRPRSIPMNKDAFLLLSAKRRHSGYVFADKEGNKLTGQNISRKFKKCVRKAGLRQEIHFHSLRHTYSKWWKGDIASLQKLLGHANITTTQIYSHRDVEDLRENAEQMKVLDIIQHLN